MKNKPENLKLYFNEAKTQEVTVESNTINSGENSSFYKKGFLSLDDMEKIKYETIWWSWPMETGSNDEEIEENDILDSKWIDTVMTMEISAIGTQVTKDPLEIAVKDADGNEVLINRMNVKDYYGEIIQYQDQEDENHIYRLFYIDYENKYGDGAGTIYLKADAVDVRRLSSSNDLSEEYKKLNPQWVVENNKQQDFDYSGTEKSAFWLADKSQWTIYKDFNYIDEINYVVGAPSIEILVDSYNKKKNNNTWQTRCSTRSEYQCYQYAGTDLNFVDRIYGYIPPAEMYSTTSGGHIWLASPSGGGKICAVMGGYWYSYESWCIGEICPLVSLKHSAQLQFK